MGFHVKRGWRGVPRQKHSFTLVEVLVVVVIMCILLSLLLPGLKNAKSMAKQIGCLNNLKQLGVAIYGYANDYGYYPMGCLQEADNCYYAWAQRIAPYCTSYASYQDAYNNRLSFIATSPPAISQAWFQRNRDVLNSWRLFLCPEATKTWGDENGGVEIATGKYTCNGRVMPFKTDAVAWYGSNKRVGFMGSPSRTGLLWDGKYGQDEGPWAHYLASIQWNPAAGAGGTPDFRHLKNICILYADGHALSSKITLTLPIAYGANGNNDNLWQ